MPNHVLNELIFRNVDSYMQEAIIAASCNAEGKVDFEILVPPPLNIWNGNVGREHSVFRQNALDWNRENWGTKWNAYSQQPTKRTADTITLIFETAWGAPYPWLAAVLNKLSLPFEHNWLDEGASRGRSGVFTIGQWGPDWRETEAGDEMHRHLHLLHWGVEEFPDEEEDASAIEARSDATGTGAAEGESAVPQGDAQHD